MARKRANGEGTIRKRADGSWEARYCADGKRHSVYGRTQAEVRKKLTEVSVTIDHGDFREDSGLTLGQWLTMWHRDYLGNVKLGTADTYEMQIRVHIIPALGDVKLSALRTPMIQRLYNKKREEGLSPKSIKNIHGCLHKALDVAVRIGYLSKNPSSNCILPRIEQAEIHPLDTPELSKLLAFLKGHEHEALIVTAIFTGLRSGELLGLTWDSVDFENGLIRVTKQLAQPRKKGEVFRFATPKNSKPRTIAPAPTVFQVLKKRTAVFIHAAPMAVHPGQRRTSFSCRYNRQFGWVRTGCPSPPALLPRPRCFPRGRQGGEGRRPPGGWGA